MIQNTAVSVSLEAIQQTGRLTNVDHPLTKADMQNPIHSINNLFKYLSPHPVKRGNLCVYRTASALAGSLSVARAFFLDCFAGDISGGRSRTMPTGAKLLMELISRLREAR